MEDGDDILKHSDDIRGPIQQFMEDAPVSTKPQANNINSSKDLILEFLVSSKLECDRQRQEYIKQQETPKQTRTLSQRFADTFKSKSFKVDQDELKRVLEAKITGLEVSNGTNEKYKRVLSALRNDLSNYTEQVDSLLEIPASGTNSRLNSIITIINGNEDLPTRALFTSMGLTNTGQIIEQQQTAVQAKTQPLQDTASKQAQQNASKIPPWKVNNAEELLKGFIEKSQLKFSELQNITLRGNVNKEQLKEEFIKILNQATIPESARRDDIQEIADTKIRIIGDLDTYVDKMVGLKKDHQNLLTEKESIYNQAIDAISAGNLQKIASSFSAIGFNKIAKELKEVVTIDQKKSQQSDEVQTQVDNDEFTKFKQHSKNQLTAFVKKIVPANEISRVTKALEKDLDAWWKTVDKSGGILDAQLAIGDKQEQFDQILNRGTWDNKIADSLKVAGFEEVTKAVNGIIIEQQQAAQKERERQEAQAKKAAEQEQRIKDEQAKKAAEKQAKAELEAKRIKAEKKAQEELELRLSNGGGLIQEFIERSILVNNTLDTTIAGKVQKAFDPDKVKKEFGDIINELTDIAKRKYPDKSQEFEDVSKALTKDLGTYTEKMKALLDKPAEERNFKPYTEAASEAAKEIYGNSASLSAVGLVNTAQNIEQQRLAKEKAEAERAAQLKAEQERIKQEQAAKKAATDALTAPNEIKSARDIVNIFTKKSFAYIQAHIPRNGYISDTDAGIKQVLDKPLRGLLEQLTKDAQNLPNGVNVVEALEKDLGTYIDGVSIGSDRRSGPIGIIQGASEQLQYVDNTQCAGILKTIGLNEAAGVIETEAEKAKKAGYTELQFITDFINGSVEAYAVKRSQQPQGVPFNSISLKDELTTKLNDLSRNAPQEVQNTSKLFNDNLDGYIKTMDSELKTAVNAKDKNNAYYKLIKKINNEEKTNWRHSVADFFAKFELTKSFAESLRVEGRRQDQKEKAKTVEKLINPAIAEVFRKHVSVPKGSNVAPTNIDHNHQRSK